MDALSPINAKGKSTNYLGTNAMNATSSSMALLSSVLGFEIVEIWTEETDPTVINSSLTNHINELNIIKDLHTLNKGSSNIEATLTAVGSTAISPDSITHKIGNIYCTYVHSDPSILKHYPNIITGHFPEHKKKHRLSPMLCQYSLDSPNKFHWGIIEEDDNEDDKDVEIDDNIRNNTNIYLRKKIIGYDIKTNKINCKIIKIDKASKKLYHNLSFPLRTELSYHIKLDNDNNFNAFIVAFSTEKIRYNPSKISFISGLARAIYVATFELDDDEEEFDEIIKGDSLITNNDIKNEDVEITPSGHNPLDQKEFTPEHIFDSHIDLVTFHPTSTLLTDHITLCEQIVEENEEDIEETDTIQRIKEQEVKNTDELGDGSSSNFADTPTSSLEPNQTFVPDSLVPDTVPTPINEEELNASDVVQVNMPFRSLANKPEPAPNAVSVPVIEPVAEPIIEPITTTSTLSIEESPTIEKANIKKVMVPTWKPQTSFSYPISEISVKHAIPSDLTMDSFDNIKHISDGSNCNIFLANLNYPGHLFDKKLIIIKMIKESCYKDKVALQEFETEFSMLMRISHPNIVEILGFGRDPRLFIVLEYLQGGSLYTILSSGGGGVNHTPNSSIQKTTNSNATSPTPSSHTPSFIHNSASNKVLGKSFFKKPTFTYIQLLQITKQVAEALNYLHSKVTSDACFIHRDLKPDNIGFTSSGVVKLFDFGLATCIYQPQARKLSHRGEKLNGNEKDDGNLIHDAYKMTGFTGSMRYMAPEVAKCNAYNEKVDVYSFGILLWQMAKDKTPFKSITSKAVFLKEVVDGKLRPKIEKSWPSGLRNIIVKCWSDDYKDRPTFKEIVNAVNTLISKELGETKEKPKKIPPKDIPSRTNSSWF